MPRTADGGTIGAMSETARPDFHRTVPPGDTETRAVCRKCGYVHYDNPKIVVGSVVRAEGGILLCRRAIAPRRGYWTIPAGYLELNETPLDGARREALEEACAAVEVRDLLAVYSVARLSQVQLIWRATLKGPIAAGDESLEVHLFDWETIPWDELAFPSVHWALQHDREADSGAPVPFTNPPGETGDTLPDGTTMQG